MYQCIYIHVQDCDTVISTTKYTHYVSIDFGTAGCAIAVGFPEAEPNKVHMFTGWPKALNEIEIKYPTVLLVDPLGAFISFGDKAFNKYEKLRSQAKDYYLFNRFKMKLYNDPVRNAHVYLYKKVTCLLLSY